MKTKIFYFSGTGNSLVTARDLAQVLGNTEVINIAQAIDQELTFDCDNIGIIFPVYIWGMPLMATRFVAKLAAAKNKYIFALTTYGGFPAGTLLQTKKLLKKQGLELQAAFGLLMPGNYTPMYGAKPQEKQQKMFDTEKQKITKIAKVIKNQQATKIPRNNWLINLLFSSLLYKLSAPQINKMSRDFWVNDNCNGCRICVQVCPTKNIMMQTGKPRWQNKCEQCLACLQWCPQTAIEFGKKTPGRKRYHHPEVKLQDFILR